MAGGPALYIAVLVLFAMHSGQSYGQRIFPQNAPHLGLSNISQSFRDIKQLLSGESGAALQTLPAVEGGSASGASEVQENTTKVADKEKQHKQWTVEAISDHVAKTSVEGQPGALVNSHRRLRQIPAAPAVG
jgi:hypothetical protein